MRSGWGVLLVLAGCSRAPASSSLPDSAPAVPPAAVAVPAAPKPCVLAAGYRGTVAGQRVFARLGRDGPRLYGRYFYEHVGIDLPLEGRLEADGSLSLVEGATGAPTGHFEGACDPRSGVLAGTWTGKAPAPFELEPIVPGDVALAAIKKVKITHAARSQTPGSPIRGCSYAESKVELFGLRNAAIETALNGQGLAPRLVPVLDPATAADARTCDEPFEAEMTQTLVDAFRELATLESSGWIDAGGAHPGELDFDRYTVDLTTGKRVHAADVFARDPLPKVVACAATATPVEDVHLDASEWEGHFDKEGFDLMPDGVHFYAAGFPHVMAVLTGQGPVIGYDVLLREGMLRADSPVRRAWASVKPALRTVGFCQVDKGGWK